MVHDQEEPPLINELGIAIQPGTHTFCGLRKEVVGQLYSHFKKRCCCLRKPTRLERQGWWLEIIEANKMDI